MGLDELLAGLGQMGPEPLPALWLDFGSEGRPRASQALPISRRPTTSAVIQGSTPLPGFENRSAAAATKPGVSGMKSLA